MDYADKKPRLSRSRARELAFFWVYQYIMGNEGEIDECDDVSAEYIALVVAAVRDNFDFISDIIANYAEGFEYDRLYKIDVSVLTLAIAEILFCDIPPAAAANEAVELAKRYSTPKSHQFVNGILAIVIKNKERILNGRKDN